MRWSRLAWPSRRCRTSSAGYRHLGGLQGVVPLVLCSGGGQDRLRRRPIDGGLQAELAGQVKQAVPEIGEQVP